MRLDQHDYSGHLGHMSLAAGQLQSLLVTVKLMRGDNSVETETRDVVMGHSQEISITVPKHLGKVRYFNFQYNNKFLNLQA